jgi:hypothetical protein
VLSDAAQTEKAEAAVNIFETAPVNKPAAPAAKAAEAPNPFNAPPPAPLPLPPPAPEKPSEALVVALPPSPEDLALSPKDAFARRQKAGLIKPDPPKPKLVLTDTELAATGEGRDVPVTLGADSWEHPKGTWVLQNGELVCTESTIRGGSMISKQSYTSCDIQFSFKLDTTHYLELYFGGWTRLVLFERIESGVWHEFKGYYRNGSARATVDGRIQNLELKGDSVGGPISLFTQGGVLRIKDVKIKAY